MRAARRAPFDRDRAGRLVALVAAGVVLVSAPVVAQALARSEVSPRVAPLGAQGADAAGGPRAAPAESSGGPEVDLPPELRTPASVPASGPALERLDAATFRAAFPSMGTLAELTLEAPDEGTARRAVTLAREELVRLEALLSEWRSDSPISQVNAAAGERKVPVPDELFRIVERALEVARSSEGTFDPTWAGLRGLWKFGDAQDGTVPPAAAIAQRLPLVDHRKVQLDRAARAIFLPERGMALGLGGIAKGYAVDRVVMKLRALELQNFVVRLGGDLYAAGRKGSERPWIAAIRDPRGPGTFATVELSDQALATTGDYERAFVRDGLRYHHVIDPRTGRPGTQARSATVRCPSAYRADAASKPVFLLGAETGLAHARRSGCDALIVDAANEVHLSAGFVGLRRTGAPTP